MTQACQAWRHQEHRPMRLGVKKRMVVLTCMDSRLPVERMFGLELGDAEVIRNAGGRVTADVLRSLLVCVDLLDCDTIVVMHHTDCGGQAVVREHDKLMVRLHHHLHTSPSLTRLLLGKLGWTLSSLVPSFVRRAVSDRVLLPIRDDVRALRDSPLLPHHITLHGCLYHTETGKLETITSYYPTTPSPPS